MADRTRQHLGHYRLVRLLGQGGFAEVYLGEHIHLGTQAAIKLLHTQLAGEDTEAFRTEARTLARLVHPHIVRVFDFGMEGETPYLVMDYAPGGTLRKQHPRGVALPLPTILDYVKQVADALQYAHDEHFIHRDVKPENLLVGQRQEILLSDFGIALLAQTSRSQSMQDVTGTVNYMAPEQFQGKPRQASDQYAFAVMVYEWLTGACPFRGSFTEIASQHLFVPPPPLREQVPDLSPAVEQVVMTALAKDPHQRFATVQAFATAFAQASQVELTETIPASRSSQPTELATEPNESVIPTELVTPAGFAPTEYAPPSPPASALAPTVYAQPSPPALPSLPSSLVTQPAEQPAASKLLPPTLSRSTASRPSTVFCWNCSSPNQATEQFCTSCFAKLSVPAMQQTASTLLSQPSSSPSPTVYAQPSPPASMLPPTERASGSPPLGTVLSTYRGHRGAVSAIAWSPDGARIASGGHDQTVQIWDAADGSNVFEHRGYSNARFGTMYALAWSPDGKRIVSGDVRGLLIWDAADGSNSYFYGKRGIGYEIKAVAWSPDGKHIASGGQNDKVNVWDTRNARYLSTYSGHTPTGTWRYGNVNALTWSPDGRRIASGGNDQTVQVWDAADGGNVFTYRGHSKFVTAVAWSPDSKRIASGSEDNTVQVWDAAKRSNGNHVFTYRGHSGEVKAVIWSPDGRLIASASRDGTVQVWHAANGQHVFTYRGHSKAVNAIAWSPDGTRIASGSDDKTVQVWQAP